MNREGRGDGINAWWEHRPGERFWLDVTNRDDRDLCLAAPRGTGSSSTGWTHRLITHVKGGDIVFHYDASLRAIVAASIAHGRVEKRERSWPAHDGVEGSGPPGRKLPSWSIRLRQSTELDTPVSLSEIARVQWDLYPALRALEDTVGDPLHYAFEMGDMETTRPLFGYVLKLPAILVQGIPGLASAAAKWSRSHGADERVPLTTTRAEVPARATRPELRADSPLRPA